MPKFFLEENLDKAKNIADNLRNSLLLGLSVLFASNMHVESDKEEVQRKLDIVIIGEGSDAEGAITAYWNSLRKSGVRAHPPVAMLHLDPARPRDAQNHHINEMQPSLESVLNSWNEYLQTGPRGPAVLLDLSPRLGDDQQAMVELSLIHI